MFFFAKPLAADKDGTVGLLLGIADLRRFGRIRSVGTRVVLFGLNERF